MPISKVNIWWGSGHHSFSSVTLGTFKASSILKLQQPKLRQLPKKNQEPPLKLDEFVKKLDNLLDEVPEFSDLQEPQPAPVFFFFQKKGVTEIIFAP